MDALRAAAAHLQARLPSGGADRAGAAEPDFGEHVRLVAALAVFAAAWARRRTGAAPVPPEASLPHAADLLRMIRGDRAGPAHEAALDTYLVAVAEHGMNASTFTARIVASTGSDSVSAVVAALGALKGPRHGGAPGPVLDLLDAIGAPDRARAHLEAELAAGRRIMGMGHRVYRVRDPRAAVLERAIESLERAGAATPRLAFARAVERTARELLAERRSGRALEANVEFYTAVLLEAVGLERALFTPVFGAARVAGWLAHVDEQRRGTRIIRPLARYVGPMPAAA
jgi:citrate synthase